MFRFCSGLESGHLTVSTGSRLGSYEILAPLGAGGMGEVWRARDTRLARDVAIKILPADLAADPERLRRFEREARAASALSHPNIVTILDIGSEGPTSFIAMELVEGKTLRALIAEGPVQPRRLLPIAAQIAEGLTRAHEAGIVHRDLKPENVMMTRDGLVKILDFGLAKLTHPGQDSGQTASALTVPAETRPGIAVGTAAYMSPEQASGHPVDFRSDQFSLGSMLYEMSAGRPAFKRATMAQTLAAIIDEEPEPRATAAANLPTPLRWVIERCLAKDPEHRYAATRDLVRDLTNLRDHLSELSSAGGIAIEEPKQRSKWRAVAVVAAVVLGLAAMFSLGRFLERAGSSQPTYRQLTFRGAGIGTARFAPDGQTIVFSSQTEGKAPELFSMRLDSPEARSLGLPPAHVLSISQSGQMAILLLKPFALSPRIGHLYEQAIARDPRLFDGLLAQASLSGGAPRELLDDVVFADWAPDGQSLAVIRRVGNRRRVESPIGKVVFDGEEELLNHLCFSTRGDRLAFKDWDRLLVPEGARMADLVSARGDQPLEMSWSDRGDQVFFTEANPGTTFLKGVPPGGPSRIVASLPSDLILYDIVPGGRMLLGRHIETYGIRGAFPGESQPRNLSHFDRSEAIGLSADAGTVLFTDAAQDGAGTLFLRRTDGGAPTRLGEFFGLALSSDGRFVLGVDLADTDDALRCCVIVPAGPGPQRHLDGKGLAWLWSEKMGSGFFPDGKSVFYVGREKGHRPRIYVQSVEGGPPRAVTPEDVRRPVLVGAGKFFCALSPAAEWMLYPSDGNGETRAAVGILPGEQPIGSTPDGLLYVRGADELRQGETLITTRVYRVDPSSGRRELWKEIPPVDPRRAGAITSILFSADGKSCVWTHRWYSTELMLAEGLR